MAVASSASLLVLATGVGLYALFLAIYRLFWSPLSKFPGPKLAALTSWYEFYYDVILRGQFLFHLQDLHDQYGPVVRFNPHELHVSDPDFYETVYASAVSGEKRDKYDRYTNQIKIPGSMMNSVAHDEHKMRRVSLNRFFSTASVRRLQTMIEQKSDILIRRFEELRNIKGMNGVIIVNHAFAAFTGDISGFKLGFGLDIMMLRNNVDVVMEYAYGRSNHHLEDKAWSPHHHDAIVDAGLNASLLRHMHFLGAIVQSIPESLAFLLPSSLESFIKNRMEVEAQIVRIKNQPTSCQNLPYPTMFHEIFFNSNLPEFEKTVNRVRDEAQVIVGGGTLTTSWAICVATYHLLANPNILKKLKIEFQSAISKHGRSIPLSALENCQYLTAVIQESLRLSHGPVARLPRISHAEMVYTDQTSKISWRIPPGTPISISTTFVHHNPSIFPDPYSFRPERWIENPRLDHYLVSFNKGTRQCLGMNLAYAEIYLCLFKVFSSFGSEGPNGGVRMEGDKGVLELFETDLSDVELYADGFVVLPKKGSKGIRIRVRS